MESAITQCQKKSEEVYETADNEFGVGLESRIGPQSINFTGNLTKQLSWHRELAS